ncbi:MAG: DUF2889 domain-containing protein [Thermodesulfobacteriota bacterium]|nr:DUF2889 domain-containing protein [Thermodesulfobacteriota bacterium]
MGGLKVLKKNHVHTRNITIATYAVDEDTVMVEGTLKDDRFKSTYSLTSGEMIPPGVIHNLTIRLLVKGIAFRIEDVEVEMNNVPKEVCRETRKSLMPLVGHNIAPGFTVWVKETFGGPKGCTHLNSLLLAMAPAVIQGYWTHRANTVTSVREMIKNAPDARYLIDTCWVWRSDGPFVKEMINTLNEATD